MTIKFEAQLKEKKGKGASRQLRREGRVPAVIYGDKKEPISVSVPAKEVNIEANKFGFKSSVITITLDKKSISVIARDVQLDPVSDLVDHVDFQRVSAEDKIRVDVPVLFKGRKESPGIKKGGNLNIVRYTIELICKQDNIPERIEVDLTSAQIGDSIHINDLSVPEGCKTTIDRNFTICAIVGKGAKKEETDEEETVETEGEEKAEEKTEKKA